MKIPAFIKIKRTPKGWTVTTIDLGESALLYLKPTKEQLEEISPNANLSTTPYGKIPPKPVSTFIKILDKIGGPPPDPSKPQPKYFDFDINKLATFDLEPKSPSDHSKDSIKPKKNKNQRGQ